MKAYVPLDVPPGELAGGTPLEPGTQIELSAEQVKENAALFESGQLLEVEQPAKQKASRGEAEEGN